MHHFDSSISWKTHSIFKWFGYKSETQNSSGCKRPVWRTVWMNYDFVPLWPDLNVAAVVFFIVTSFPSNPTWSRTNGTTLLLLVPIDNLCLEAAIFEIQFQLPLKSHYETARSINTIWLHHKYVLSTSGLVCCCNHWGYLSHKHVTGGSRDFVHDWGEIRLCPLCTRATPIVRGVALLAGGFTAGSLPAQTHPLGGIQSPRVSD